MVDAARVGGSTPSFQHSLALLGQYFNKQHANRVTVAEVDTGFLLYFFTNSRWTKPITVPVQHTELLELTDAMQGNTLGKDGIIIKGGDHRDKKHPLCPMGYDVFFRAVGVRLDRRAAVGVAICEAQDRFYVNYWVDKATFVIRESRRQAVSTVQMETFDAAGVKRLLQSTADVQAQEMVRFERALKLNPHDHLSMQDAAFMFENDGDYRQAESLFNRVALEVPEHPEIYYHIARLALVRGDKRAASSAIKRALKHRSDDAAVQDLYGRILRQTGNLKGSIAAFERAVDLEAGNGILHYHLAKAYEAAGRAEDAEVQMALSTSQHAAPAWDMVQEDIAIEVHQAAPQPRIEQSPAQAALLPPAAAPGAFGPSAPELTTTFDSASSAWPTDGEGSSWAATAMKLTTFDELPPAPFVPPDPTLPPPMTLEQRMQAARGIPPTIEHEPAPMSEQLQEAAPRGMPSLADEQEPEFTPQNERAQAAAPIAPAPSVEPERPRVVAEDVPPPEAPKPKRAARIEQPLRAPAVSEAIAPVAQPVAPVAQPAAPVEAPSANAVELAAEIMMIQRSLEAEPNRADLHRKLGFLLARQGKTAEAATEFRKALQASRTSL